jgi:hypothetical protein
LCGGRVGYIEGGEAYVLVGDFRAQLVPQLIGNLKIDLYNTGIELAAGTAQNLFTRLVKGARLSVRAVAGDGIQGVGYGKYAGAYRNPLVWLG